MNKAEKVFLKVIGTIFKLSEAKQKMILNSLWLLLDKFIRLGLGFLINVQITRFLKPEGVGLMDSSIAFVQLFWPLVNLGMDTAIIQDLIAKNRPKEEILGTGLRLRLMGSMLALLLSIGISAISSPEEPRFVLMVALQGLTYFCLSFDITDHYFQAQLKTKYTVYARNSGFLIANVWKVYLLFTQASVEWFITALTLEALLSVGLQYIFFVKQAKESVRAWHYTAAYAKVLINRSLPLMFSGFVVMIYMRIDTFMIKKLMDNSSAGIYSAAVKLSEIWFFLPYAIIQSIVPALVNAHKSNISLYLKNYQRLIDLMVWISIGMGIVFSFSAKWIVLFLYKEAFLPSADILIVHIWSGVFVTVVTASSFHFTYENLQKIGLYRTAIGAGLNVGLNFWLIPTYGPIGAAFATLVSYGTTATISNYFFKPSRVVFFMFLNALNPFGAYRRIFLKA